MTGPTCLAARIARVFGAGMDRKGTDAKETERKAHEVDLSCLKKNDLDSMKLESGNVDFRVGDYVHVSVEDRLDLMRVESIRGMQLKGTIFRTSMESTCDAAMDEVPIDVGTISPTDRMVRIAVDQVVKRCIVTDQKRMVRTHRITRSRGKHEEDILVSTTCRDYHSIQHVQEESEEQAQDGGRKRKRLKLAKSSSSCSEQCLSGSVSLDSLAPRTPRACAVSDMIRPGLEINGLQDLQLTAHDEAEELAEWSKQGRLLENGLRFCRIRFLAEDKDQMLEELDGFYSSFTLKKDGELYAYMAEMTSGGVSGKEDFAGFHVALLRNGDGDVVSAATLRISPMAGPFGRLAEVPFVATFPDFRRCGYCADLMVAIERCCARLGAHLLVLPTVNYKRKSATQQELWWRKHHSFSRFKKMSWQQMQKLLFLYGAKPGVGLAGSNVVKFPDCVHLWKEIPPFGGWERADKVEWSSL